ncbi:hypothetical protein [Ferrovum sp.]|uniref:hypothetical protein n=1 Tax=Ferrovum sp. TaxID=2609467 RepID=UPI0026177E47|nr:hypothetical protein [Ferrovum sp.]
MSTVQTEATELLCNLLEDRIPEINGGILFGPDHREPGKVLAQEGLFVLTTPTLSWVTCPSCGIELARIDREMSATRIMLRCPDCQDIEADIELKRNYRVNISKTVERLAVSLDFKASTRKEIVPDQAWRLGMNEPARGQPITWYFARRLYDPNTAQRVLEQVRADNASNSARIITTSEVPLPGQSPLAGYQVTKLSSIARVSQSRFVFFDQRIEIPPENILEESCYDSLRYVRTKGIAYVAGKRFALEPMQKLILLALIDDHDHRMDSSTLKVRCGSNAASFSPTKQFERNPEVYKAFITYDASEKDFTLVISDEDRDLLK